MLGARRLSWADDSREARRLQPAALTMPPYHISADTISFLDITPVITMHAFADDDFRPGLRASTF